MTLLPFLVGDVDARAEYKIDVGDTIEIQFMQAPEMTRRTVVKSDGSIAVPLVNQLLVAGLSNAQLELAVKRALAGRIYRRRGADGRLSEVVLDPQEVSASIAEYRPIYVTGDVVKPGEYTFRPGVTAAQAIAMAGGYIAMRGRPLDERINVQGEYDAMQIELAKESARIWRIGVELGERSDDGPPPETKVGAEIVQRIVELEKERLETNRVDLKSERTFVQASISLLDDQIRFLTDQKKEEEQGLAADQAELSKMQQIYGRGAATNVRLTEARRAVLLSATRQLQTSSQLLQLKRQRDELSKQLSSIDTKRRMLLIGEMQDAIVRSSILRTRIQAAGEKLLLNPGGVSSGLPTDHGMVVELRLDRKGGRSDPRVPIERGTPLQPGDILDVSMRGGLADAARATMWRADRSVPVR